MIRECMYEPELEYWWMCRHVVSVLYDRLYD